MEAVKSFNDELSGIYETKPPISRAKMTILTKKAIKGIKFYKHIVQSVEKFIQKCRPEYKVPGLYVIDSVVRQSRHQFGPEKDVFMPRLCKNILTTFQHIYKCPSEDKPRVLRVLNLWQKNNVFPQDIVQQLMVMGGAPTPGDVPATTQPQLVAAAQPAASVTTSTSAAAAAADPTQQPTAQASQDLTNILANLLTNPDPKKIQGLAGLLSTSQQNQLQELLKQVKANDPVDVEIEEEIVEEVMEIETPEKNTTKPEHVFQQQPNSSRQLPFLNLQNQGLPSHPPQQHHPPAFNRAVLDYDYSDDEKTPPSNARPAPHHPPSIDPALLAKLPTADQLQQITVGNGVVATMPPVVDPEMERRKQLELEQENFNKQIQEMSSNFHDGGRETSRGSRDRRKRSRSRSRDRRSHRRRSHSRDRGHKSRRSRSRDRSRRSRRTRSRSRSRDKRRERAKEMPPVRSGCVSVCTTTLWIGNLSSKVMQHELEATVAEHGEIESINMIPPRGCAYICMKKRAEASKALNKMRNSRLGGKSLKCAWAASKEMPDDQKSTWVVEYGVNYVPLSSDPNQLKQLSTWGFVDPESVPEDRRAELTVVEEPPAVQSEPPEASATPTPPQVATAMPGQMPQQTPFGVMPNMAMSQAQMPMLVRPGFPQMAASPFPGVPRQMPPGFPRAAVAPQPTESKTQPKEGETTPTRDETPDEQQQPPPPQLAAPPQFRPSFSPMPMQRFGGPVPVQIRMMAGVPPTQLMQTRMGMMPIRMGLPMQIRPGPGFHPAMGARMPVTSGPPMMGNPMQQMRPGMHPMPNAPGFQPGPAARMRLPRPDMGGMIRPGVPPPRLANLAPSNESDPRQIAERLSAESAPTSQDKDNNKAPEQEAKPENNRAPSQERENFAPRDFGRPMDFDRPPQDGPADRAPLDGPSARPQSDGPPNRPPFDGPPGGGPGRPPLDGPPGRPPNDVPPGRTPLDGASGRPPHDGPPGRPPFDGPPGRPPPEFGRPRGGFDNSRRGGFDRERERRFDRGRSPPERERSYDRDRDRDRDRSERSYDRDRDRDRPPRDFGRDRGRDRRDGPREMRGGSDRFRDFGRDQRDRGGRDFDRDRRRDFDRHDNRDRGPPRFDRGRRGGDRGFGRGRGGFGRDRGGGFHRDGFRRSPEIDEEEEEEYRRKREETLRKRHAGEDEYVTEQLDLSAFGLPSGFGGSVPGQDGESGDKEEKVESDRRGSWREDAERTSREEPPQQGGSAPKQCDLPTHDDTGPARDNNSGQDRPPTPGTPTIDEPDKGQFVPDAPPATAVDAFQLPDSTSSEDKDPPTQPMPMESDPPSDAIEESTGRPADAGSGDSSSALNEMGGISAEDY